MAGLDNMEINDEMKPVAQQQSQPGAHVPATKAPSKLQQLNDGFDGLGDSQFAARVVLDGTSLLYKDSERVESSIEVQLTGGRKVHQFFEEASNSYYKSYDGKFTEDGEPISKYPEMRHMFELDWMEDVDGEPKEHQLVLSPTSRYAFVEFAQKLSKLTPAKKITEVTVIITAARKQNKDGQRYSQAEFTCAELIKA